MSRSISIISTRLYEIHLIKMDVLTRRNTANITVFRRVKVNLYDTAFHDNIHKVS